MDHLYWWNVGEQVEVGDRQLAPLVRPSLDAPETTALCDASTGTLFSADALGALLSASRQRR